MSEYKPVHLPVDIRIPVDHHTPSTRVLQYQGGPPQVNRQLTSFSHDYFPALHFDDRGRTQVRVRICRRCVRVPTVTQSSPSGVFQSGRQQLPGPILVEPSMSTFEREESEPTVSLVSYRIYR